MSEESSEKICQLRLKRIEEELNELTLLIDKEELYKIPKVLYHEPHEVPGHEEMLLKMKEFESRFRTFLQSKLSAKYKIHQEMKEEFISKYQVWNQRVKDVEERDPPAPTVLNPPSIVEPVVPPSTYHSASTTGGGTRSRRVGGGGGDVVRSEAELNQILLSLLEQERDNPATRWMATLAVTPRMRIDDPKQDADDYYFDENGRLPADYYLPPLNTVTPSASSLPTSTIPLAQSVVHFNGSVVWTEKEQRTFVDKFLAFPKNFRKIASYLPFKRTSDCVAFYYRNKKHLRLKQLRKSSAVEAQISKVKLAGVNKKASSAGNGPGRPQKKARRPGRPPKNPRPPLPSSTEEDMMEDGINATTAFDDQTKIN